MLTLSNAATGLKKLSRRRLLKVRDSGEPPGSTEGKPSPVSQRHRTFTRPS
jgi:hypothetical protein